MILLLISAVFSLVHPYTASSVCFVSPETKISCSFEENTKSPLFESRIAADQLQLYETTKDANLLKSIDFEPRSYSYFNEENKPDPAALLKNINIGYLNQDGISSLDDLIKLNSEEIGVSHHQDIKAPDTSKVWQVDEVQSLRAPQYLPDVVIPDTHYGEDDQPTADPYAHVLSDTERKLGRFVVRDEPQPIRDVVRVENSLLTREVADMDNVELEERDMTPRRRYLRRFNSPKSIVLNSVIHTTENSPSEYRRQPIVMEPMRVLDSEEEVTIEKSLDEKSTATEAPVIVDDQPNGAPKEYEESEKRLNLNDIIASPDFLNVIDKMIKSTLAEIKKDTETDGEKKKKKKKKNKKNKTKTGLEDSDEEKIIRNRTKMTNDIPETTSTEKSSKKNIETNHSIDLQGDNSTEIADKEIKTETEVMKDPVQIEKLIEGLLRIEDGEQGEGSVKQEKIESTTESKNNTLLKNTDSILDQVLSVM